MALAYKYCKTKEQQHHNQSKRAARRTKISDSKFLVVYRSNMKTLNSIFITLVLALALLCLSDAPSTAVAKSQRPISDTEIRQKKNECYADIESGLWGWQCKSSMIAKENCALKCLSPPCYELVYEGDPLEEGEKDLVRSQEYKYCMHRLSIGESLDGIKGSFDY